MRLFDRDRRSVTLTRPELHCSPRYAIPGSRRQRRAAGGPPVRDRAGTPGVCQLAPGRPRRAHRVGGPSARDPWVAPSHTQAERVADGSLDLAVCWVPRDGPRGTRPAGRAPRRRPPPCGLGRGHRRRSGGPGRGRIARRRHRLVVVVEPLRRAVRARHRRTHPPHHRRRHHGPGVLRPRRRSGRPVLRSPKDIIAPIPPDLHERPVVAPEVYWTWSLVWRSDETRAAVHAVVEALSTDLGDLDLHRPDVGCRWRPAPSPGPLGRTERLRLPEGRTAVVAAQAGQEHSDT